jgi:hypothetical protein
MGRSMLRPYTFVRDHLSVAQNKNGVAVKDRDAVLIFI